MKRLSILLLLALPACTPAAIALALPSSPAAVADRTSIDEASALGVEIAYKAAGALIEAGVDTGRIRGADAVRVEAVDARAAYYVGLARAAYDSGNAAEYAQAAEQAQPLIAELRRLGSGR